jgi:hypothetical protein
MFDVLLELADDICKTIAFLVENGFKFILELEWVL